MILNTSTQADILQRLQERLQSCYVFPEIAEQICSNLQKHLEEGVYAGIDEGDFFAYALTTHLQEVNHDEHLWVRYHAQPLPEDEGPLRLNLAWQAAKRQEAQQDAYGFHQVEILPENIGYIDIRYFHRPEWAGDAAAEAMSAIADARALIIDLRQCTGGFPGMVALVCSYLFGVEPVHLASIYWRDDDITQEYWTQSQVPGQRFEDKPVYVLISKVTFSGGEAFADALKTHHRATLVGEKTDGGSHPGASYRIHPHFEAFIPVGRVINPLTNTDWEGVGILPDVAVTAQEAFDVAYQMASKPLG